MNKNIIITLKKELRTIFRDKKTILRMFLFPIIIPAMIFLYGYIYDELETEETTYQVGTNYELSEIEKEIFSSFNLGFTKYPEEELKDKFKADEIEAYIILEDNTYKIYTDQSNTSGMMISSLIEESFNSYNTYLTNEYLLEKGIDLQEAYNHFNIEFETTESNDYFVQIMLLISITYIIMSICLSTSSMATNATAAEKENGTLETILTFPIKRTELLLGKYFATAIIGFMASLIALILTIIGLLSAKQIFDIYQNLNLKINILTISGSIVTILLASIFIAAAAFALTCFAKSFKEAQSSSQYLNMISLIPMFVGLMEVKINYLYYLIPICNYEQIIIDLYTNNLNPLYLMICIISTIIYITIVITYIIKAYNSEKILYTN